MNPATSDLTVGFAFAKQALGRIQKFWLELSQVAHRAACMQLVVILFSGKAGIGGKFKGNGGGNYRGCWMRQRQRWSELTGSVHCTASQNEYEMKNFLFTGTCSAPTHFFSKTSLQFFFLLLLLLLHVLINSSIIRSLSAAEILSSGSRTKSVSISRRGSWIQNAFNHFGANKQSLPFIYSSAQRGRGAINIVETAEREADVGRGWWSKKTLGGKKSY